MSTWALPGAALGEHLGFFRKDIEIESEPVPSEEGVALFGSVFEVLDQGGGFLPAHPVIWIRTVAAVPEGRLVGGGEEGGGAGDAQEGAATASRRRCR